MRQQDALFNWLQMQLVAQARPDDRAAVETRDFFAQILTEDHRLHSFGIASADESAFLVEYEVEGETFTQRFDRELAEQLLADINSNPKYNE